jgi:hypothetical protein
VDHVRNEIRRPGELNRLSAGDLPLRSGITARALVDDAQLPKHVVEGVVLHVDNDYVLDGACCRRPLAECCGKATRTSSAAPMVQITITNQAIEAFLLGSR